MTLAYGYVKTKVTSEPIMKASRHGHETQYHLHCNLQVDSATWDVAVNVGTNDADDLLKYKLAFDFRHPLIQTLAAAKAGSHDLTGQAALPALDFMRSDLLANTGKWRDSDVMDGSDTAEPAVRSSACCRKRIRKISTSISSAAFTAKATACTTSISIGDRPRASSIARAMIPTTTTTSGRTARCWSMSAIRSGRRISRHSTSNWCRPTTSEIRSRGLLRFEVASPTTQRSGKMVA
jgi:hypothetical protein